jgi:hypothetical protein
VSVFVLFGLDEFLAGRSQVDADTAFAALILMTSLGFNRYAAADELRIKFVQSFDFLGDKLFESF